MGKAGFTGILQQWGRNSYSERLGVIFSFTAFNIQGDSTGNGKTGTGNGIIHVRFYEELNDYLPAEKRKRSFAFPLEGGIRVDTLLQNFHVPPDRVELILVNGVSVDFTRQLENGDRVSVYPVIESLDVGSLVRVREKPLRRTRFMVNDPHLGRLAAYLRLMGFDTMLSNFKTREEMIRVLEKEGRILLTRDAALLRDPSITRIHYVRHAKPRRQLIEILTGFDLYGAVAPYSRCPACNAPVKHRPGWKCRACGQRERNRFRSRRLQLLVKHILSRELPKNDG